MKKLNFVYDKKSGDLLAPQFVANHVVAIRNYTSLKDNKDLVFNKFPGDFELVTVDIDYADNVFSNMKSCDITPFIEIVGDDNG